MRRNRVQAILRSRVFLILILWGASVPATVNHASTLLITFQENKLSARVSQAPLSEVLAELARQIPLTVSMEKNAPEEGVNVAFDDLSLLDGIKRILEGQSYILLSSDRTSPNRPSPGETQLKIVFLSSPSSPPGKFPVSKFEGEASTAPKQEDRISALEAYFTRGKDEDILKLLDTALHDPQPRVREKALELLKDLGEPLPLASVTRVALKDPSSGLRVLALGLLAELEEDAAEVVLTQALGDSDRQVRKRAEEYLEDLGFSTEAIERKKQRYPSNQ